MKVLGCKNQLTRPNNRNWAFYFVLQAIGIAKYNITVIVCKLDMGFGEPLTQNDLTIWSLGAHSEHLGTSQHLKENVMQYFYVVFKSRIFKEIPCRLPLQYKCYQYRPKMHLI